MPRDYENLHDLEDLDDYELRELVRERLADTGGLDAENITVRVTDGVVHLLGRVGTESERRIAERALTDGLGLTRLENELVVDALRRSEDPDDPEDAEVLEAEESGMLGGPPEQSEDTAAHLQEDLEGRLFGTTDMGEAIEEGLSYSPPDGPTPEGFEGMEDRGPEAGGERH